MSAKNKAPMPEQIWAWEADRHIHGTLDKPTGWSSTSYTCTDYAQAQVAAAYEAAASRFDEIAQHDQEGIDYSSMVGIPISNLSELERSVKAAESDAEAIRDLTPTDAREALDRLIAEAVKETLEKAAGVAESVALPIDGKNAKAQADYMRDVIATSIRALKGGEA